MTTLREGKPEEAGMRPDRIDLLRERCAGWVADGHTPSLSVLAARRGVVVMHEAFGVSGPEPDSPALQRGAVFPMSSATKPVTGTLALILAEDGLLGINRPVVDYLPELAAGGEGIDEMMVHHLLTHSSGYTDAGAIGWSLQKAAKGEISAEVAADMLGVGAIESRWDCPRTHPLGSIMSYCQHNYLLLGVLLKRISGQSLDELARERLFGPLGMEDSSFGLRADLAPRRVRRPDHFPMAREIAMVRAPGVETPEWARSQNAAGGAFSTAWDMGVFGQTMLNGGSYGDARVLSPAGVREMTRDQIPGLGAEIVGNELEIGSYGYGWIVESTQKWGLMHGSLQALGTAYHSGAGGTSIWLDPHNEIVGVYLEVLKESNEGLAPLSWHFDFFQNLVTGAIDD